MPIRTHAGFSSAQLSLIKPHGLVTSHQQNQDSSNVYSSIDIDVVFRSIRMCQACKSCALQICGAHSALSNSSTNCSRFAIGWPKVSTPGRASPLATRINVDISFHDDEISSKLLSLIANRS